MRRTLIRKDEQGNWCLEGIPRNYLQDGQLISPMTREKICDALERLAEYEDTGLEPDEIKNRLLVMEKETSGQKVSSGEREDKVMMELRETAEMMNSADYKERFKAEYWQTKIRYEKLKKFNTRIEAAGWYGPNRDETLKHGCPESLLREQQNVMGQYLHMLEVRAEIEKIDLE